MTTQHTPGPWTTDGNAHSGDLDVISPAGRITLIDCEFSDEPEEVLTANARLIAAAPDLLAALQKMLETLEGYDTDYPEVAPVFGKAYAALSKATGAT